MAFDWQRFLVNRQIPYVIGGVNQNAAQIGIKCPLCGTADPSEHLSLSRSGRWVCRRVDAHWGSDPARLIMLLLRISYQDAADIVGPGAAAPMVADNNLAAEVARMLGRSTSVGAPPALLRLPRDFLPIVDQGLSRAPFGYLLGRGYTHEQAEELVRLYDLRYTAGGLFRNRVILPIYNERGLVSWTGRAVGRQTEDTIRYLSLSDGLALKAGWIEQGQRVLNIHDVLFNQHELARGGDLLVVGEGPFDGIALDFIARSMKSRGTCLFGKNLSITQRDYLLSIAPKYRRKVLLLDPDAVLDAFPMREKLLYGGYEFKRLPTKDDPGATPQHLLGKFLSDLRDWG